MPYFISWVIVANIFISLLSGGGAVNRMLISLGITRREIYFFQIPQLFPWIIAVANTWKSMGYNSIIFLAVIVGLEPQLYEAAQIDEANKWRQTYHVTLPALKTTIIILLILSIGHILNGGFEQQLLMQNDTVREYADVIDLYAYRYGLQQAMYSYGAAVGFFRSTVSFVLVIIVNRISKAVTDHALF